MLYTIVFEIRDDANLPGLVSYAHSCGDSATVWGTSTGNCIEELNSAEIEAVEYKDQLEVARKERKEAEESYINTLAELANVRTKLQESESRLAEVCQGNSQELLNAFKIRDENTYLRDELERMSREKDKLIYRAEQAESNERLLQLKTDSYATGRKEATEALRPWLEHRRNQGCLHGLLAGQECSCGLTNLLNQR